MHRARPLRYVSHPVSTVTTMSLAQRSRSEGRRRTIRGRPADDACLVELRTRLARRCGAEPAAAGVDDLCDAPAAGGVSESGLGTVGGVDGIRNGVSAALGPLLRGPLVAGETARSADDADLVWCAQAVQRAINALEGARSTLAAEATRRRLHARRGEASGAETLVNATAVGGTTARRIEREAEALAAQPQVAEALGRGEINAEQAAAVATADVPDEVRSELCAQAGAQTADQTRTAVRAAEAASRIETDAQRRARQRAARSASMWTDAHDGMWHLRARFDALTGDEINRQLMHTIQRHWRSDRDLPESQRRTVPQRAADALAWLLTAAVGTQSARPAGDDDAAASTSGAGSGPVGVTTAVGRPSGDDGWVVPNPSKMIVITTLDNLRNCSPLNGNEAGGRGADGHDAQRSHAGAESPNGLLAIPGAAAITETGTALGAADLRRLACDTRIIPVVMGGAGEVLDVGRATRTIPPAIRSALIARDQRCVWPGCDRAPIHCDGHHIEHWVDNGPTCIANLALLCHCHHQRLHEYNLELHPPDGPAPPGEGWTVTPAPPRPDSRPRTPAADHTRQDC